MRLYMRILYIYKTKIGLHLDTNALQTYTRTPHALTYTHTHARTNLVARGVRVSIPMCVCIWKIRGTEHDGGEVWKIRENAHDGGEETLE